MKPADAEGLDELLRRFAAGGFAPLGAEVEGEHDHGHGHAHGAGGSVREFTHRGHTVRVVTRYEVTIDGEPWEQPLEVAQDGTVMSHALPQYVVASAVDLIKGVIDHSYEAPEEIQEAVRAAQAEG